MKTISGRSSESLELLVRDFFFQRYNYVEICGLLRKEHDIDIPVITLKRTIATLGLKRKNIVETDVEKIIVTMMMEIDSSGKYKHFQTLTIQEVS